MADDASEPVDDGAQAAPEPEGRSLQQRLVLGAVLLGGAVLAWIIGAAVLPRWWARRMGNVIDGSLTTGTLLGVGFGFVFTVLALLVLWTGWRFRGGWRRFAMFVFGALVVASPNLLTLGIVMGNGSAAHAGERTLDVDGPGFRGGTLVGAIAGLVAALGLIYLLVSRRRNKRKATTLKAELAARDS